MFTENDIQKLNAVQHIRLRPGMYVGGVDRRALHHLIYEVMANAADEILNHWGDHIWITLKSENLISVRVNGRGMRVDSSEVHRKSYLELLMTEVFACGRGSDGKYRISGGFTGVGLQAVNALSSSFTVEIRREGYLWRQSYQAGAPQTDLVQVRVLDEYETTGTTITFQPDYTIFEENDFQYELIAERARELAYLVPRSTLIVNDERTTPMKEAQFYSPKGLEQLISDLNKGQHVLHDPVMGRGESTFQPADRQGWKISLDYGLQYRDCMDMSERSYANTIQTVEGGTHLSGLWSAIVAVINEYALEAGDEPFSEQEIAAGLSLVVSIKHEYPAFDSMTKIKLINPEVSEIVRKMAYTKLQSLLKLGFRETRNDLREIILNKCRTNREALRKL